jgi:hypothetical protein
MKESTAIAALYVAMFLILLPYSARGQSERVRRVTPLSAPTVPERARSMPRANTNNAGAMTGSVGATGATAPGAYDSPSAGMSAALPSLRGTSFGTIGAYYNWNNYYSYLYSNYNMNPLYFSRFYRNVEPLITPDMLKLTLRTPILLGEEMINAIDQLELMLKETESETTIDRQALREKSESIRKLAKEIRRNRTLSVIDLRKKRDLYKREEHDSLSPESLAMLREMAVDLNRQLREMYRQSSTAVISVDSYNEPSLESLAKGIEEVCKDIEKYSKQM